MTHARARSVVFPPLPWPTSACATLGVVAMMPATVAPGTCWLMSMPINLYALALEAGRMTVEADRQAWHRRFEPSAN